ncbi:hypothetical protein JS531_08015 [Bifidobacterium sp. CP2]|uniref:hypothetical protein n=1 Tax=Bifidobacterium sp. CP2 TaxID=2809025 RepID=UPI001BDD857A|nr:hypothetical protein [Bifidobacterium sp. CP2]MBT1181895.1 hypothetical protein [Bifidobacterium sp. CP2]
MLIAKRIFTMGRHGDRASLTCVFTGEFDLDHIQEAYEAMDQRRVIKSLIRF